jgi:hypothetical protein
MRGTRYAQRFPRGNAQETENAYFVAVYQPFRAHRNYQLLIPLDVAHHSGMISPTIPG